MTEHTSVYVTKYWESKGIFKTLVKIREDGYANGLMEYRHMHLSKSDYALTSVEAQQKVSILRDKKIKSLQKRIDKLNNIKL